MDKNLSYLPVSLQILRSALLLPDDVDIVGAAFDSASPWRGDLIFLLRGNVPSGAVTASYRNDDGVPKFVGFESMEGEEDDAVESSGRRPAHQRAQSGTEEGVG